MSATAACLAPQSCAQACCASWVWREDAPFEAGSFEGPWSREMVVLLIPDSLISACWGAGEGWQEIEGNGDSSWQQGMELLILFTHLWCSARSAGS